MDEGRFLLVEGGDLPLVAGALHDGHAVRPEALAAMALPESERLREEDPHTAGWTEIAGNRLVGLRSRFEVDLNRPRERAVYLKPEDAWGLHVWKQPPAPDLLARLLADYDAFYAAAEALLRRLVERHGRIVVYDIHTYNHRRGGPGAPPADPATHPGINLGTRTMERDRWAPVVDRFAGVLRGQGLDVRENVKFGGGYFPYWVHATFPDAACCLAIEIKKTFMDEWSGAADPAQVAAIRAALASTVAPVVEALGGL